MKTLIIEIDEELHTRFKVRVAEERTTMTAIILKAIEKYISNNAKNIKDGVSQ